MRVCEAGVQQEDPCNVKDDTKGCQYTMGVTTFNVPGFDTIDQSTGQKIVSGSCLARLLLTLLRIPSNRRIKLTCHLLVLLLSPQIQTQKAYLYPVLPQQQVPLLPRPLLNPTVTLQSML